MKLSLDELKAMNDKELFDQWMSARFPFESLSDCRQCLTLHGLFGCAMGFHPNVAAQVHALGHQTLTHRDVSWLRAHLEELYAMRLYFDSLYPQTVEPAEPSPEPASEPVEQREVVCSAK